MDLTEDGTLAGSMDFEEIGLVDKIVIGPECSFCAAVMVERVEGANVSSGEGSAITSVDAHLLAKFCCNRDCFVIAEIMLLFEYEVNVERKGNASISK